ncbi:hypothetical protein A2U01_0054828, partial [Trifolium medium]|nr:hypothetical protein [Trifolium medium]
RDRSGLFCSRNLDDDGKAARRRGGEAVRQRCRGSETAATTRQRGGETAEGRKKKYQIWDETISLLLHQRR